MHVFTLASEMIVVFSIGLGGCMFKADHASVPLTFEQTLDTEYQQDTSYISRVDESNGRRGYVYGTPRAPLFPMPKASSKAALLRKELAIYLQVYNYSKMYGNDGYPDIKLLPASRTLDKPSCNENSKVDCWIGPYIDKKMLVDPWGTPYQYSRIDHNGKSFRITSLGSDKKPGGTGDAQDVTIEDSYELPGP